MAGTSSSYTAVQLEAVQDALPVLVEAEAKLDKLLGQNMRAKKVSTRNFRIPMKTALPGAVSMVNLDSGDFPRGGNTAVDVGTITPLAYTVPIELTKLVELSGKGDGVSIVDVVNENIADATTALGRFRDIFLQTDGAGNLATVLSVASLTITVDGGFGARLLARGQKIGIYNGNTRRGTAIITDVNNTLGGTQSFEVDAVPGGTADNDIVRVDGLTDGAPVFINGIPVFNSTSGSGTLLGIARSNSYMVANGIAASSMISEPLLRLLMNQVRQALGDDALAGGFWHTHPSQLAAYEELGLQRQIYNLEGGKAGDFDALFRGKLSVAGKPIYDNIHADQTRWDLLQPKCWGKVKWGNPPFWFENQGRRVFEVYGSNSVPTAGWIMFLIEAYQTYCDNVKAGGAITSVSVPTNN